MGALAELKAALANHGEPAAPKIVYVNTPAPDWTAWEFTTDVGWNPADIYSYKAFSSPQAVKNHALQFTGPGVLTVKQ